MMAKIAISGRSQSPNSDENTNVISHMTGAQRYERGTKRTVSKNPPLRKHFIACAHCRHPKNVYIKNVILSNVLIKECPPSMCAHHKGSVLTIHSSHNEVSELRLHRSVLL